jgi:hypothetical protein
MDLSSIEFLTNRGNARKNAGSVREINQISEFAPIAIRPAVVP